MADASFAGMNVAERRIRRPGADSRGGEIMVEPKLMVRQTTSRVPKAVHRSK